MFNLKVKEILTTTNGKLICKGTKESISGVSTDTRTIKKGDLFIALKGKNFDGHNFVVEAVKKGASSAMVQLNAHLGARQYPLLNTNLIRVRDTLKAFGDIAHHYRMRFNIPLIGITGSNGKTTTKEIISRVLSFKFDVLKNEGTENNLIGVPKTLLRLNPEHEIGVLELGTNHFGEIKRLTQILRPDIGIITNIGPAHLEFLKSIKGVFEEKTELLKSLGKNDTVVINADDVLLRKIKKIKCKVVKFGIDNECDFKATQIIRQGTEMKIIVNNKYEFRFKLLGRHNIYNALAAIALGFLHKIDYGDIYKGLLEFGALNRRAFLKRIEGLDIIDDTYNSNIESLKAVIDILSDYETLGKKILVCGDMLELGNSSIKFHKEAATAISDAGIDYLISVGRFSEMVKETAILNGMRKDAVISCGDNRNVLDILKRIVKEGDVIALKGSRLIKLDEVVDALSSFISAKRDMVRV